MENHNIARIIETGAERFGARPALGLASGDSRRACRDEEYSYESLFAASSQLAAAFREAGLQPDDRVALLAESRPRWGVAFFAALHAGAVALPLDVRQSVPELRRTLNEAAPKLMLVGSGQETLARELLAGVGPITVLSLEPGDTVAPWPSMDTLPEGRDTACALRRAVDAAVLTFTSGTTGNSRGVVTTHGNLGFEVRAIRSVMQNDERSSSVSILPLSQLFELTAGFLGILNGGGRICYCNSLLPAKVIDTMQNRRVTFMVVMPLFLELIRSAIRSDIARRSTVRRRLFALLTSASALLPMRARRRLFAPIHRRFGSDLHHFVCGGEPLAPATRRFFARIGLPVYQGHWLADTRLSILSDSALADDGAPEPVAITGCRAARHGVHCIAGNFHRNPACTLAGSG